MTASESANRAPPEGLRVFMNNEVCAMGELDRCILAVWHRLEPTRDAFDTRHKELVELAAKYPGRSAYLELIEPGSKPPPNELRKIAVEVFRKLGRDLSCIAFVVDGTELRSAFVRAVLATMGFFLPAIQPSKVFKRLGDAAEWVRPRIGETDTGFNARMLAAFDYLRHAYSSSST